MQILTVKDVIVTEYEKLVSYLEKNDIELDIDKMSNLELAGNLYSEFNGNIDEIKKFIAQVNKETNNKNKFKFFTIINICKVADQAAGELFELPCSMPGTLISKICSQSKGFHISDEIYEKYFGPDSTQHQINLKCYYSVEYNRKDNIYYLKRDLDKSPRKEKKIDDEATVSEENTLNVTTDEETTNETESTIKIENETVATEAEESADEEI